MKRFLIACVACVVSAATAFAQVPYFPQTLPAGTIVGRMPGNAGPTEAIPFKILASTISPTLSNAQPEVWNSEYSIWNLGNTFSGVTTGTHTSDTGVNGPGVGGTFTVSKSTLTIAQMALVQAALPTGSVRPRYAKNLNWTVAPTAGEGRVGYTGYFSTEEMNVTAVQGTAGKQITVSAVLWTNASTSIPNVYLYADQTLGSGGSSGRTGSTISGTGAGTDYNTSTLEVFNRSAGFSVTSTPTLYSFTVTLDSLSAATIGSDSALIIGVGVDYTAIGVSQQLNMTALNYNYGSSAAAWTRPSDSQTMATAFGGAIYGNGASSKIPAINSILYMSGTLIVDGILPNSGAVLNANTSGVPSMTTAPVLGLTGSATGTLGLRGATSGTVTLTPQAAAGTPTITFGTSSGTPAVTASSPLAITTATGNVTCATCATTTNGGAISGTAPIAVSSSGVISLTAPLSVANGGTNATSASITAFNNITGYTASGATGTTSTNLVFSTSPAINTPTIAGGTATGLTGLAVRSTGAAFDVTLASNESTLSAGRTLNIVLNNGNRGVSFAGDLTLGGSFTTSGASAVILTSTGSTNVTLPTTGTLATTAQAIGSFSARGVNAFNNTGTPNTQFDITANEVLLRDSNGLVTLRVNPGTLTNNVSTAGSTAGGRDQAGAFSASSYVHFYWIWNGTTLSTVSSATAPPTGPTLPSGYTAWAYVGAVRFDGSSHLLAVHIRGNLVTYDARQNAITNGAATSSTALDLSTFVPPNAMTTVLNCLYFGGTTSGAGNYSTTLNLQVVSGTDYAHFAANFNGPATTVSYLPLTNIVLPNVGQNVYYYQTTGGASPITSLDVAGYTVPNGS